MTGHQRNALACLLFVTAAVSASPAQIPARSPTPVAAYTLPPETAERAVSYSRARYRLHFAGVAWQFVVLAGLVALRFAPRLRDLAERASRRRFVQALVFVPAFFSVQGLFELPVAAWRHRLALFYEQSVQGWGSWLWDRAKEGAVGLVLAVPVVWLLYAVLKRSPRRWWIWFWLATFPIVLFVVFLAPFVIDPLFFEFNPLAGRDPALAAGIEQVTARGGLEIPQERMFVMDASRKLKSVNAYVTGLGASKRVVVWDTTLARLSRPQTLFVFGHEMGHYVLGHVLRTILFMQLLVLVLVFVADRATRRLLPDDRTRLGIRGRADWASLPVLLLLATAFSELSLPVVNGYSRAQEHAADVYALEVVHGVVPDPSRAAAEAFQALGEINLSDPNPGPFIRFWLYSHPPIAERIAFARSYDPWSRGEPNRFVPAATPGTP